MNNYTQENDLQRKIYEAESDITTIDAKLELTFYKLTVAREILSPEQVRDIEQDLSDIQLARSILLRMIRLARKELKNMQQEGAAL